MLASASGPLGALLMIAPLAAIPVFAVVGLPQFAPVAASPVDEEVSDLSEVAPPAAVLRPAPKRTADDLFAPIESPGDSRRVAVDNSARISPLDAGLVESKRSPYGAPGLTIVPPEALDDWEVAPSQRGDESVTVRDEGVKDLGQGGRELPAVAAGDPRGRAGSGFTPGLLDGELKSGRSDRTERKPGQRLSDFPNRQPIDKASPGDARMMAGDPRSGAPEPSGWKLAADRLKQLGIRKYLLESQIEAQQFLFRCEYPNPDSPEVTELFEAVADTPLEAVLDALRQIDEWLQSGDQAGTVIE